MKEYRCYYQDCRKPYNSKYNLIRHINCNHLKIQKYFCLRCSKHFPNRQNLEAHEESLVCCRRKPKAAKIHNKTDFLLSDHYRDEKPVFSLTVSKVVLPPLPLVEAERTAAQEGLKLPTMPVLIPRGSGRS